MVQLEGQMKSSKYEREQKVAAKAKAEQALGDAKGEKADTEAALAADTKYLKELNAECAAKTRAFEERQATRAGELEAIGKAVEILSGKAVTGGAAHVRFLQQKQNGRSLA